MGFSAYAAYAALAAAAIGGVASYQQGQYQAQVAENNAKIQQQNAKAAIEAGAVEEQNRRLQTAQQQGKIRAAIGASGVDPNFGSSLDLQSDAAKLGELDALTIRNNAARKAYGFQIQGLSDQATATLDRSASYASLLGGASSVGSKYQSFSAAGAFG